MPGTNHNCCLAPLARDKLLWDFAFMCNSVRTRCWAHHMGNFVTGLRLFVFVLELRFGSKDGALGGSMVDPCLEALV